jgi:hypothetical protein
MGTVCCSNQQDNQNLDVPHTNPPVNYQSNIKEETTKKSLNYHKSKRSAYQSSSKLPIKYQSRNNQEISELP